ncbi:hypothetical protein JCM8547_007895 [Rhodosporidiobolus lusitaniae]
MVSPDRAASPERDSFAEFDAPPTLPLPPGTYTLLPLVEQCDNAKIPQGPWTAADCKRRWEQHRADEKARRKASSASLSSPTQANGVESSALADEDDDEEEQTEEAGTSAAFDREFIAPFFLSLPPSASSSSAPGTPARRSSSSQSSRPSFSRLTPLPTLPPSSPTSSPSHAVPLSSSSSSAAVQFSQPIGFLRPSIVRALIEDNRKLVAMNIKPVWRFDPPIHFPPPTRRPSYGSSRPASRRGSRSASVNPLSSASGPGTPSGENGQNGGGEGALKDVLEGLRNFSPSEVGASNGSWAVAFEDWVNEEGLEARREHMDRIVRGWKMAGQFLEQLGGWRDEEYTIWGPAAPVGENDNPLPGSNEAFRMERSACALFGLATFGVHCTAYVEEDGKPLRFWVPRRSATKQTWPSMLDNTVAGGITAGDTPRYSILRECAEEASLPPSFVSPRLKAAGCITYDYRTSSGWLQPEVQYVYDLRMPDPEQNPGCVKPTTNPDDGEVESFELMEVEEVVRRMVDGEFKPNCALVLIDFFLRHGLITFESDSRFIVVATRLHKPLILPGPA